MSLRHPRQRAAMVRRVPLRVRLLIAAAMVGALVVGCGAYTLVQRVAYAPEEPVEDLVAAFNDGDVERAARLAGCASRLCQAGVLRQGYQAPTDLRITGVARGDRASVGLRYRLAGAVHEVAIEVERGGPVQNWKIVSGATGYLDVVSRAVKSARVAGATVPTIPARRSGGSSGASKALLGAYPVSAEDPLFTAGPVTVTVTGGSRAAAPVAVELELAVKPAAAEEVDRQIRAWLDECARGTDFSPRRCPFGYAKPIYKPADVTWRIDDYPQVELQASEGSLVDTTPLTARTVKKGHATVSYTSGGVPQTATVEIDVRGYAHLDENGKITFTGR